MPLFKACVNKFGAAVPLGRFRTSAMDGMITQKRIGLLEPLWLRMPLLARLMVNVMLMVMVIRMVMRMRAMRSGS